jgi:PKD repeat protein
LPIAQQNKVNMKKILCLFIISHTVIAQAFAQSKLFIGQQTVAYAKDSVLQKMFTDFSVFYINSKGLKAHCLSNVSSKVHLELGSIKTFDLNLRQNDIRSADYRLVVATEKGNVELPKGENITYMGHTDDGAKVRMTINDHFIVGYFMYQNEKYFLEPLNGLIPNAAQDLYILYNSKQVIPNPNLTCGLTELVDKTTELDRNRNTTLQNRSILTSGCINIRLAVASDYDLYANRFGSSVTNTTNHTISVTNNVITDFDSDFDKAINFSIVTNFISTTASNAFESALTTSTLSLDLLNGFSTWASDVAPRGFGVTHDLGSIWVKRKFEDNIIGRAWLPGLCRTSYRYNILNGNFSGATSDLFRVLASHECGHNLNCRHDFISSPYIMAPSVNSTSTWSPSSMASINDYIVANKCLSGSLTSVGGSPIAYFKLVETECKGKEIALKDESFRSPTLWNWTMSEGTPSSVTAQNASVTFNSIGLQRVALTVSNRDCGSLEGHELTRNINIIESVQRAACLPNNTNLGTVNFSDMGIYNVLFGTLNNSTFDAYSDGGAYFDNTCYHTTTVIAILDSIDITASVGSKLQRVKVFLDLNNDGIFQNNELLFDKAERNSISGRLMIPNSVTRNKMLRMRVICDKEGLDINACTTPQYGQVEDYGIVVTASFVVDFLDFTAEKAGEQNLLKWQTATALNNSHFIVQKSKDGKRFIDIGRVKGNGTTTTPQYYDLMDATPYQGLNYYRLKAVNTSGNEYSAKIATVNRFLGTDKPILIYPNPAQQFLTLEHDPSVKTIEIINTLGQLVKVFEPKIGTAQTQMRIADLPAAVYFLRINQSEIARFLKL